MSTTHVRPFGAAAAVCAALAMVPSSARAVGAPTPTYAPALAPPTLTPPEASPAPEASGPRSPALVIVGGILAASGALATATGGLVLLLAMTSECPTGDCHGDEAMLTGLAIGLPGLAVMVTGAALLVYGQGPEPTRTAFAPHRMRAASPWPELTLGQHSAGLRWAF